MNQQMNLFDTLGEEGRDVEFKSAKGGLPGSLWETYSAFANTDGGVIYLGVRERGDEVELQGVDDPDKMLRDFWSVANDRGKVSVNLLADRDLEILDLGGPRLIAIHVPRASREFRPVHVGPDPYRGSYRRNHEGDFRCSPQEVQRMFADRPDQAPADSRILQYFSLDDLDTQSLRQFRNRMGSRSPDHPWLLLDDTEYLAKLGGWRRDRREGIEGLTLAGLLMFGKQEAITDNEALPGFHLDYRERLADDESVRWSDRLTVDGTWEANLFQFYIRVVQKIGNDSALKVPFARDAEGYRKGQSEVHEALQEALVNALIHADHGGQGGVVIDRHRDRFEFSNPGTLLLSIEQLLDGGVSECRNKSLQQMFQLLGAGDKAGSGLDKIRASWHAQHWQSPSLRETLRPDRVVLTLPMVSMLPEGLVEALKARFGVSAISQLNEDEVQALITANAEGRVTNRRLQTMLTRHRVDITEMFRSLVERRMLIQHSHGRGTYYELFGGSLDGPEQRIAAGLDTADTSENDASSIRNDASSIRNNASSIRNDASSIHNDHSAGPEHYAESHLEDIAKPVRRKQRAAREVVESTIVALCSVDYLSLQRLAELLQRNPISLRNRYINPLVRAGRLMLRYPDKPNHSQQAYRTTDGGSS
ncbi:ATP-binding protein [Salinisphaera sp. RV14]|uniref:ATP-binding protein n=1 Tax=Salinisphaera sp. RV14 TaxID=3454140 RepID=UPI003F82C7D4